MAKKDCFARPPNFAPPDEHQIAAAPEHSFPQHAHLDDVDQRPQSTDLFAHLSDRKPLINDHFLPTGEDH